MIRRYLVVFENGRGGKGAQNLTAYVPDVPGCWEIGSTMVELRERLHDALEFHLEQLALDGKRIPEPIMGPDDVRTSGIPEWLVVRLRLGGNNVSRYAMCRPCPGR